MLDGLVRFVDVLDGLVAKTACGLVMLTVCHIAMRISDSLQGAVKPTRNGQLGLNRRMHIQIFPILDSGIFDHSNGFVDFVEGPVLVMFHDIRRVLFQQSAGVTQVGQCVQISRMRSGQISGGHGCGRGQTECQRQ
jgi:hypothetical protein